MMMKRLSLVLMLCLAVALVIMPAAAVKNVIAAGGDVFIGEQGLNVTAGVNTTGTAKVAWFEAGSRPATDVPNAILTINPTNFYVAPSDFVGKTGNWYVYPITGDTAVAFTVNDPSFELKVWDLDANKDVTGKSVTAGERLDIRLETNFYVIAQRPGFNSTTDGYVLIKVRTADGAVYSALNANTTFSKSLQNVVVNTQPFYWANQDKAIAWNTSAVDSVGQRLYKAGVYTLTAENNVNFMRDNYVAADGSFFTGKTVTAARTVTIASDTVKIEANKDSVVRGNPFSVTITGRPNQAYFLWVKGTGSMTGSQSGRDQPPFLTANQDSLKQDNPLNIVFGNYVFQGSGGRTIQQDVPTAGPVNGAPNFNGTIYYGSVTLSNSGTRTIEYTTTNATKDKKYTIRVEQNFGTTASPDVKSDEVDVSVEKGAVTVVAAGDQSYFLGEEVKLSGTDSETDNVYLLITGPNLPSVGGNLLNPREAVINGQPTSFTSTDVLGDNTWEYKWQTANLNIDSGSYTVYAIATPNDKDHLGDTQYATVSVIIRKPFVSATTSQTVVARGDSLYITGVAEGNPSPGIAIWILGKNKNLYTTESVNSDATFSHEVTQATTASLASGQYFVVVQHPMYNDVFDVFPGAGVDAGYVDGSFPVNPSRLFKLDGAGALQGSDAAEALIDAINNPSVDDTYTKLQFLVEEPIIRITPVTEKQVGDKFTINGTTNLAVDDEILVEVISSSFGPTPKTQSGEFSGQTGTVIVEKGTEGFNRWSFAVDASTFKPDEYIVQASGITVDVTANTLFNVVEFKPTTVPTTVPTTTVPVNTTVTTAPPTATATTVKPTTTTPGFGALIALIGLGAVAFLVVRKH